MSRLCTPFRRYTVSRAAGHAVPRPVSAAVTTRKWISADWSRRTFRPLLALGAVMLVQACTTPYGAAVRQYREIPVCCASLAELPVEPLQVGDKRSFDLGDGSLAYQFTTGKSYFRAFALPLGPYPYRVTVRSFLVGDRLKSAYLFYPQLITLDEQRRVVRTTGPGTFALERTGLLETLQETGGLHFKLEGGLTFTTDNRDERYLVVLTTDELLRGKTLVSTIGAVPMFLPAYSGTAPAPTNQAQVPHAPAGRVAIAFSPLALQVPVVAAVASAAGETKAPAPTHRPEAVTVRLANGKAIGELELGRTTVDEARRLFDTAGAGLGTERQSGAKITVGTTTLAPQRLYVPPGTLHQLYFDDNGVLVLFVTGASTELPASGKEFLQRFPGARETGRTMGSLELQASLAPCVTLVAVFRTGDDILDSAAYGYSCPTK